MRNQTSQQRSVPSLLNALFIDLRRTIPTAVRDLPAKQRAAVLHRYVNDLAYVDIGRVMGCSEEAARRSVHEGLKKLRTDWAA